VEYVKELATAWGTEYDWRKAEERINAFPQYLTEIDGAQIHFLHVTSPERGAVPVLLTHGWPGSIVEFLDLIGPLTNPVAYGGRAQDAVHLVVPSLPGFGFSGPLRDRGWDVPRVARAFAQLMASLGYSSYVAAGGDWGSIISLELGRIDPDHVRGMYVSTVLAVPSGEPGEMEALSESDAGRVAALGRFQAELSGYLLLQGTRPVTLSYGLEDSPVGLLAWIGEKFHDWDVTATAADDKVGREALLTNTTLYWLTGTGGSGTQYHYESGAYLQGFFTPGTKQAPVHAPIGVVAFAHDSTPPVRSFAERDYPTITQWTELPAGHFATLESPGPYLDGIRTFLATVR
jgi:microsomal epoxide hydrolase